MEKNGKIEGMSKLIKTTNKEVRKFVRAILRSKNFKKNLALFCASIVVIFSGMITLWLSSFNLPDFTSFGDRKIINSTKIYDRTGEILLYDINKDVRRTNIPFEKMGVNIKNATVAIEDSEFYNHNGVRITSTIRAVLSNIFGIGIGGGGSTITQQLVKNTLLTKDSGFGRYTRKLKEWVLAVKIDRSMSKEDILEAYLNEIPYGGTIYGIQEASRTYFNKNAEDLTVAEAAYLASVPQSPTTLSPYGKNKPLLETRKNLVLSRMLELGFISEEEHAKAKGEVVTFELQATSGIRAPHFVFFIKEYLEQKYGSEMVEKGGLKVTTTLNFDLQEQGEKIVNEVALKNSKDWNGENGALVAIDPKTGQILTMVGSRDYFDKEIDGNFNVATASRQPGSSFKPFIYATAFNKGFTPDTVLFDLPTEFQSSCNPYGQALPGRNQGNCYMPSNYDNKSRGPMTLRAALAESINVIAVKLFFLAGLPESLKTAEDMGISTLTDVGRYGLTLVIGGGEVSLLDMTSAYGVFANDGKRNPYTGILKVEDVNGRILEEYTQKESAVLPKNTALTISDILKDEVARVPTFGSHSVLYIPNKDVAVKTGTTNSNKDAWTVGYTPSVVVGAWAGNNDNAPMKKGGAALAGPIWNRFINEALKVLPSEKFEKPNLAVDITEVKPVLRGSWLGNENFFIDKISGKLATEYTPKETLEEKIITNVHSILYWVDKKDITGPPPSNPEESSQFINWEIPIQNWWAENSHNYQKVTWSDKPLATDNVHTTSSAPKITIVEPNQRTIYEPNQEIRLTVTNQGRYPLQRMDIFVNDIFLETTESPFVFSFLPEELENLQRNNVLKIIAYDAVSNRVEVTSSFTVDY